MAAYRLFSYVSRHSAMGTGAAIGSAAAWAAVDAARSEADPAAADEDPTFNFPA